jgi:hypothetical protein
MLLLMSVEKIKGRNPAAVHAKQSYRGGRDLSQPAHDPVTRRRWKLSATPWPLYLLAIDLLPTVK